MLVRDLKALLHNVDDNFQVLIWDNEQIIRKEYRHYEAFETKAFVDKDTESVDIRATVGFQ
jgi:hypothetical protein